MQSVRVAEEFSSEVIRVMASAPPSGRDDLLGMVIDFDVHLAGLEQLDTDSVDVAQTSSPECLIRAKCRAAEGVTLSDAGEAIRDVWLTMLRYSFFEAHCLRVEKKEAVLEFVTQIGPGAFFVTGRVEVAPARS